MSIHTIPRYDLSADDHGLIEEVSETGEWVKREDVLWALAPIFLSHERFRHMDAFFLDRSIHSREIGEVLNDLWLAIVAVAEKPK